MDKARNFSGSGEAVQLKRVGFAISAFQIDSVR